MRQVVQLRKRSRRSVEECLNEVVEMRPRVEKRYVYIGAVTSSVLKRSLEVMTQGERDELLASAIKSVFVEGSCGRTAGAKPIHAGRRR